MENPITIILSDILVSFLDQEYLNFIMDNLNEIRSTIFVSERIVGSTNIEELPVIIGFVPNEDEPVAYFNIVRILHDLRMIHGNLIIESPERFNILFKEYFDRLNRNAQTIIENREMLIDDEWGTVAAKDENVHDGSVNMMLLTSYTKLLNANNADSRTYDISNIISYIYERSEVFIQELIHIDRMIHTCQEIIQKYNKNKDSVDNIDELLENIDIAISRTECLNGKQSIIYEGIRKCSEILMVINQIKTKNEYLQKIKDTEVNVLLNVWKRIHYEGNNDKKEVMLDNFCIQMESLVNKNREGGVECVNGRICALISVLELNDCDDIIDIKSVPAIRINMMQNRAPKIIEKLYEEYVDQNAIDRYLGLDDNNDGDAAVEAFRTYLKVNCRKLLWAEFGELLPLHYFNKYMKEIEAEF